MLHREVVKQPNIPSWLTSGKILQIKCGQIIKTVEINFLYFGLIICICMDMYHVGMSMYVVVMNMYLAELLCTQTLLSCYFLPIVLTIGNGYECKCCTR
jgi:hypothetical protein